MITSEHKSVNDKLINSFFLCFRLMNHHKGNHINSTLGNLTILQIQALHFIRSQKKVQIGEIAQRFDIVMSTATALVDRLVKTKLVSRIRDKKDRRIVFVSLTEGGKRLLESAMKERKKRFTSLFSKLSTQEKENLLHIINKIV